MKAFRVALLAAAVGTGLRGADEPATLLSADTGEGEWRPLIDQLASKGAVVANFTEKRYFPFHRGPTTLKGVLRFSPAKGLSLQYTEPEPSVLIADAEGLLLRDKEGRTQGLPADSRETGAIASLLPIMSFNLAALYPRFAIHARHDGPGWRFDFTPRNADIAGSLGDISIGGAGPEVTHIEFRHSASTRVEIDVAELRSGSPFAPAELKQFFR
jgi:hypothetical protein